MRSPVPVLNLMNLGTPYRFPSRSPWGLSKSEFLACGDVTNVALFSVLPGVDHQGGREEHHNKRSCKLHEH
jgi:hypothetical protein